MKSHLLKKVRFCVSYGGFDLIRFHGCYLNKGKPLYPKQNTVTIIPQRGYNVKRNYLRNGDIIMKKLFIVNPVTAKNKLEYAIRKIKEQPYFSPESDEIIISEYAGHVTELAKSHSDCEIYSVGGDGTFLEAVNGAAENGAPVCFLPLGSGNDFVRSVSEIMDFDKVVEKLVNPITRVMDLGSIDGGYFANIASVGFDAEIVKNADKFKNIPVLRKISYIVSVFYTLFSYKGDDLCITVDGKEFNGHFLLTAAAIGQYYGGGICIAPKAVVNDGFFDVLIIDSLPRIKVLFLLPKLMNGSHLKLPYVHRMLAKSMTVEKASEFLINIDGDLKTAKKTVMHIVEKGLKIILPEEGAKI